MNYYLILLIPLLLIYPFIINKIIYKKTETSKNKKRITYNIFKIIIFYFISALIIYFLLNVYDSLIPSSTSNLCINTGGFTYSCKGDIKATILLIIIGIIIAANHFITQKYVFNIYEHNNKVINYIFIYTYMIIIYILNFFLLLYLYGIFKRIYFDNLLIEVLRLLVCISPTGLFILSSLKKRTK